ncbi:hypothetical protein, partial [Fischerella thermalis]|uniref:hypothetical protein n=1 Tax=Fischerella thermalis TaxID=372787 RepID=UPI001CA5C87F
MYTQSFNLFWGQFICDRTNVFLLISCTYAISCLGIYFKANSTSPFPTDSKTWRSENLVQDISRHHVLQAGKPVQR